MSQPTELIKSIPQCEASLLPHPLYELSGYGLDEVGLGLAPADLAPTDQVDPNSTLSLQIDSNGAVSRVLAAAVINRRFCRLLLTNPAAALAIGYRGESFMLSTAEKELLLQINATTLPEFAKLLLRQIQKHNAA